MSDTALDLFRTRLSQIWLPGPPQPIPSTVSDHQHHVQLQEVRLPSGQVLVIEEEWTGLREAYSVPRFSEDLRQGLSLLSPQPVSSSVILLDVESMGLGQGAGNYPFLTGLGYFSAVGLRIHQALMTSPAEEQAYLEHLCSCMDTDATVVTYNGATFDIPLLRSRFALHDREAPLDDEQHLDLMKIARTVWQPRLSGYRLQLLEQQILGVHRHNDIAPEEIPTAYANFLQQGEIDSLMKVIEHNAQDLFAVAAMLGRLAVAAKEPEELEDPLDIAGLGLAAHKALCTPLARRCLELVQGQVPGDMETKLARKVRSLEKKKWTQE